MAELVNKPDEGNADAVLEPVNPIPEKLREKSAAELADMYQELEKKLGSQSEEIGELRRSLQNPPTPQQEPEQELDFYSDPQRYVEQLVEQKLRPVSSVVQKQQEKEMERRLDSTFTDWRSTVKSAEFQEWVTKSPIRKNLWTSADFGDYDAASELFGTWEAISGTSKKAQQKTEGAVKKDRAIRNATTERGTPKLDGRKTIRRVDLQELRRTNPDKYNANLPDIRKAYQEGRVID